MHPYNFVIQFFGFILSATCVAEAIYLEGPARWAAPLLTFFVLPPVATRILTRFVAPDSDALDLSRPSKWWTAHHVQMLFSQIALPEACLRTCPGLYSAWLRLWGSRIGRGVVWSPGFLVTDRQSLEIGDGVVFGYAVSLVGHVLTPRAPSLRLSVRPIAIGNGAFVGAFSRVWTGNHVEPDALIKSGTTLPPIFTRS